MAMRTPGGQTTYRFDQVVPDGVKKRMDDTDLKVNGLQDNLKSATDELAAAIRETGDTVEGLTELVRKNRKIADHMFNVYGSRINDTERLMYAFLQSKFMRFLNFFGCWYIYSDVYNGLPFLNCPANEKYGKAPLLTRLSRWFRVKILNQPDPRGTYYNCREPEKENTEVCTNENDAERVQPAEEQGDPRAVLERDRDGDS